MRRSGSALTSTGAAAGFFAGVIDEARIWSYARSAQEIVDNKNIEIQSAPGLVGRWGLNEGTGTIAADSSGNAINGTLVNGPLWAAGYNPAVTVAVTRGPYLQTGTSASVIVRWRTSSATNSRVDYGTSPAALTQSASDATSTTEHEIKLTGLSADTQYYYAVGTSTVTLASGSEFTFFTSPAVGTAHPTRIWVLGDSGTKDATAAAVRNGYTSFAANRYTDVWLMLGDNAYDAGTDSEFQAAVFDMYPTYLRQSPLWSALGNHETNQLTNPDITTVPYFKIFTFPTNGEAGGVPSGTEKYYSFDYGRIHFIALDSMTSSRQPGSPMLTWLQTDLESTNQDWIIAFWHHPPYTKGSHNSDTETELKEMRTNVLPLLEAGGVDLVLAGHSHSYERSYFINGHYGLSSTFSGSNLIDGGNGREDGTGTYDKPAGLPANQGAVYVVAGNGGHVTNWTGGSTAEFNPNPPPAMYYSALHVGSLAIDVNGNRLDAKMIRETGAVDDYFSIVKNVPNTPPTVSISSPTEGATFAAPANITVTANAADTDGSVAQVDFYAGNTLIGSDTVAPFSVTWNNVAAGNYALTATATDNLGATVTSAAVNISVTAPPPAAPTGLTATAGDAQVSLSWAASTGATNYNVKRATVSGGPYTTVASALGGTSFTDTGVTNGVTYFYVATAVGTGGESANSNEASATPTAPTAPPAAPGGVVATAGNAQVLLSWTASSGATTYTVKRGTVSGGPYASIATGLTGTSYTDAAVTNGTTYFYVVTASNSAGESANSTQVSATPTAPPTAPVAPSNLVATAISSTQVNLAWSDNSSNENGFQIERSTNGNLYTQIATVGSNVSTFSNTGLSGNKKYFYRVRAFNAVGTSAYSNEASTKTPR
jgi:fibronectin type 3 domain-containing protein